MKLFRYSMENILDYRKDAEEEEKQKFAEIRKEYMQQKEVLDDFEQKLNDAVYSNIHHSRPQVYELKNLQQYIHYLKEKMEIQRRLVLETEGVMETRRRQMISAHKDRRMMEKHKEKARYQFDMELEQVEQKINDELALYSYMRK